MLVAALLHFHTATASQLIGTLSRGCGGRCSCVGRFGAPWATSLCASYCAAALQTNRVVHLLQILASDPDLVVVAMCGFDLPRTKHETQSALENTPLAQLRAVKEGQLWVVDGNFYFNRPGPRLVQSAEIMANACHGSVVQLEPDVAAGLERWTA